MPHLIEGIPEMDVPSIDPLAFSSIKIDTGSTGSVSMKLELLNGTISGLRNLKIENHKMNFDNIIFSAILIIPEFQLEGTYKMNGRILFFELNGEGLVGFNATGVRVDSVWYGSTYMKKNQKHVSIDKIKFNELNIKSVRVMFDNLFDADNEVLTDTVNNAINDNIDTLKEDFLPIMKETLIELIRERFNRVYQLFPMDQLYLNN
ncbi:hypothetical protein ILUMI_13909 [Ignelater luminosus]|uniref:Protein takeout n=1 Tax=Ignelater luminosus TaxID=2038154 RepID=A0A8K0CRE8_IGNLU|nr:hypothetical protein ILUMI_13909 [Ignelater luminosus]